MIQWVSHGASQSCVNDSVFTSDILLHRIQWGEGMIRLFFIQDWQDLGAMINSNTFTIHSLGRYNFCDRYFEEKFSQEIFRIIQPTT